MCWNEIQKIEKAKWAQNKGNGERNIGKASTLEDSAVDFQRVFLFFLEEEDGIYASKVY